MKKDAARARSAKKRIADGAADRDSKRFNFRKKNDQASLPLPPVSGCEENRRSNQLHKSEYVARRNQCDHVPAGAVSRRQRQGRPGGESFQAAIRKLYKTAFTIKMASKVRGPRFTPCAS